MSSPRSIISMLCSNSFRWLLCCAGMLVQLAIHAQTCPPNIDFEKGTLEGWRCYTGSVLDQGGVNVFDLTETPGPVDGRHTIIPASGAGIDPFGNFPTRSPNGSDYCVMLGNNTGGGQGEAITYEFTIPANRNTYSLLYYYAVVFEGPNHEEQQQPRMEIEVQNLTKGEKIECASFAFIPFGTTLPGFFESPVAQSTAPVYCKNWTPVTINLDGNAGSTIRLTFRTGDCTFRRHFGYAYIDVASDCSGEFTGASFCAKDPEVTVSAPFGFKTYTWFNADMTQQIGTGQSITLRPPPPPGTVLQVRLEPFEGFGCPQTLTARLEDNLNFAAVAGPDTLSCNLAPVRLGEPARPGLLYQWNPPDGLSNPAAANPIATPGVTTNYMLTVRSPGGGCISTDTVTVTASNLGNSLQVLGKPQYCIGSGDSAVLEVNNALQIQWYKNGVVLPGENTQRYKPTTSGLYRAFLQDEFGCSATTPDEVIDIASIPKAAFAVANAAQCLIGNQFVFTNNSSNAVGAMRYRWEYGNAATATTTNVSYSYPAAGTYQVKLVVNSNDVCADSTVATVQVYPNPVPQFDAVTTCIGLPFVPINQTNENIGSPITYSWRYGNVQESDKRTPDAKVFANSGTYSITLSVSSAQCPTPVQSLTKNLVVERPATPQRYTAAFAIRNVPLQLDARNIGVSAQWLPALMLNNANIYKPIFTGAADQDYTIVLTTIGGCKTVDTMLVQIVSQANIEVPNAFTPNADGRNDFLRPVPMGVATIKYFRIFSRWGELLFESQNSKPGWDGTHRGMPMPAQTVVWMVEGIGLDGKIITKKGTSVLIR